MKKLFPRGNDAGRTSGCQNSWGKGNKRNASSHPRSPHANMLDFITSGGQQAGGKGVWLGAAAVHWLFSSEEKVRGYGVTGHPLKEIINTPAVLAAASSFTRCAQNGGKFGSAHVIFQPQARRTAVSWCACYNSLIKTFVIGCFRNPPSGFQWLT